MDGLMVDFKPRLPLLLTPPPTALDHRQGRLLSGQRGEAILRAIRIHTTRSAFSLCHCDAAHTKDLIRLFRPVAILAMGTQAAQLLTRPTIKKKYWLNEQIPAYATIEPQETNRTSKMLEFYEDLYIFARILYMCHIRTSIEVFGASDISTHSRYAKMLTCFTEHKFHVTSEYLGAINS